MFHRRALERAGHRVLRRPPGAPVYLGRIGPLFAVHPAVGADEVSYLLFTDSTFRIVEQAANF